VSTFTSPLVHARHDAQAAIDALPPTLPVAVVITDLDGFGPLNERAGRAAGDAALTAFDAALGANLPRDAHRFRIGGDEWAIVLPATSVEHALVLMDEVRQHLDGRLGPPEAPITVSAGVAGRPPHGATGDELLRAADEAVHRSKRDGRNRVAIYVEDKMVLKSNYYPRASLERLARLSRETNRTEASLLREALDTLLATRAAEL
jgi:diguanylate cyclase